MTGAPASELQTLHNQLAAINTDITVLASPVQEVDDLLGKIEDALKRPAKINQDLGEIEDVLKALHKAASDASWIPEIGEDAQTVAEALQTAIDIIGEIRSALTDIQKGLDELIKWLNEVKTPVDKVLKPIHSVELEVTRFADGTGRLIQHFGPKPPQNVETCAAGFARALAPVVGAFDTAKDKAVTVLDEVEKPLRAAEQALAKIVGYVDVVQTISRDLEWLQASIRVITKEVDTAESYGKTKIEWLLSKAGKALSPKLYRKVVKGLNKAKDMLHRLEAKITAYAFSPIQRIVKNAESALEQEIKELPGVAPLEAAAAEVTAEFEEIEDFITNELSAPCANLLRAETAPD
jgi:DNA repair exonuclease SbcCD ATPase subunit